MPDTDSTALYTAILIAAQFLAVGGAAWLLLFPHHVHGRANTRAAGTKTRDGHPQRDRAASGIDWGQGAKGSAPERRQPR